MSERTRGIGVALAGIVALVAVMSTGAAPARGHRLEAAQPGPDAVAAASARTEVGVSHVSCDCADGQCPAIPTAECGEYREIAPSCDGDEACRPSPQQTQANASALGCMIEALADGRSAELRRVIDYGDAARQSTRFVVTAGDGTLLDWSRDEVADAIAVSTVERRRVPPRTEVRACATRPDPETRWRCLTEVLATTARVSSCEEATSWVEDA